MPAKLTQKIVNEWLEAAWRNGFSAGVDGNDNIPDFADLYPGDKSLIKKKLSFEQSSQLPYDATRCNARMFKAGWGVQCTRCPGEGSDLCKIHAKKFDSLTEGLDLPFGRFNGTRPNESLDKPKGNKIAWADQKTLKSEKGSPPKKRVLAKEMRGQLTDLGVSIDGLKGKELTARYNEVMSQNTQENPIQGSPQSTTSSEENHNTESDTILSTNTEDSDSQTTEILPHLSPRDLDSPNQSLLTPDPPSIHHDPQENTNDLQTGEQINTDTTTPQDTPVNTETSDTHLSSPHPEEPASTEVDDGAGCALTSEKPSTVSEYKEFFAENGISTDGIRGRREFKQKYLEYISLKNESSDDSDSDDSSDEELNEDKISFVETTFEDVTYLEDEDSDNIYNTRGEIVGSWDENCEQIIWKNESFQIFHESARN